MRQAFYKTGTFWALVPVVLLGSLVALELYMVHRAVADPSFAVEDRYYAKAITWNARLAEANEDTRLGWRADVTAARTSPVDGTATVKLVARDGSAVHGAKVTVDTFAIVRAEQVFHGEALEGADGVYRVELPFDRTGRWEVSVEATHGADRFTTVARVDVPEVAAP